MGRYVFKMPDLGEGTVEAEIVAWHVKVGDLVKEDQLMAEVMTDKAAVEVPAPVTGRVLSVNGQPGEMVKVGSELIVFETDAGAATAEPSAKAAASAASASAAPVAASAPAAPAAASRGNGHAERAASAAPSAMSARAGEVEPRVSPPAPQTGEQAAVARGGRVMASPATRRRAREAGIDLTQVSGSGPSGRITRQDLAAAMSGGASAAGTAAIPPSGASRGRRSGTEEMKVIGLRRVIAQRMSEANRTIPHFAYVEEVDVTELESLRRHLNGRRPEGAPSLTYLPFLVAALVRAIGQFPQCNAYYDDERNVIVRHHAVHAGIATQTPDGLKVPVVRHAEARGLWDLAAEIRRLSDAARTNKATREELTGSTITVTSLGRLGGIVSTPIINAPELAIIGVNKAVERPVVIGGAVAVRLMMNLSSSFDHRFVDGFDAAAMIQVLKEMLEHPATIFIPE
jgi:2-oxoisovalerate dehydrogenase E2 component (dihydrolipoyl transacylase)